MALYFVWPADAQGAIYPALNSMLVTCILCRPHRPELCEVRCKSMAPGFNERF